MNIMSHIQNLQKKHDDLQILINTAFLHLQDDTKIKQLKKQKLMLKDKILLLYKDITNN
ncbi:MAG: DUF465 domain-containing protein [Rickettsia endosymbiont of Pseudomimeciton antennatum]|nr:DUF465 domain-containing protein [Rickettsia endosymbiont of Pseudomimeciton antennatum]MCC8398126.1 DUF465 domain-containing protein [Rickettsia endosymbiont of Labidopullus appendiculatus]